jgi:hypothetical protein
MRRVVLLLTLSSVAAPSALPAQQAQLRFARWEAPNLVADPDTVPAPRGDYRYEGLAFGGLVFGALGAYLGSRPFSGGCLQEPGIPCDRDENRLEGGVALGLIGAAVGGGLGYLVGRFSPKRPRPGQFSLQPDTLAGVPDSVRVRTGYQHWRGAGLGLLIGTGFGALAGAVLSGLDDGCDDCSEVTSAGEAAVLLGLLGAGSGGVVGFLAGLSSPKYAWVQRSGMTE